MNGTNLRLVLYFLTILVVLIGGFALLFDANTANDETAAGMLGLVVGLLVREGASILSTQQVAAIAAAAPTVTTTAGPPQSVTVTPSAGTDTNS